MPDNAEVPDTGWGDKSPAQRQSAMSWMQRLKRDLNIDIEVCEHYGGQVKVIASIEDPKVIELIFKYLKHKAPRLMPPDSANCHQSGHHRWLAVCSFISQSSL